MLLNFAFLILFISPFDKELLDTSDPVIQTLDKSPFQIASLWLIALHQNFLTHNGFDFTAIKKAMVENKWKKRKRGASTISQQTAKNLFLWQGRSWVRKGLEVYFTFLIEVFWSKERIMEVYLNIIEMGDGIYGAEAASQHYFHKSAANLSNQQAAAIAAILPNPRKFSATNPSRYTQKRQRFAMRQMRYWGGRLNYDDPKELEGGED